MPVVIPHEIPQPNFTRPYNGGGILQTPIVNQFVVPATQFQLPILAAQNMIQPHTTRVHRYCNQMGLLMLHIIIMPMVSCTWTPKALIAIWRRLMWVLLVVTTTHNNRGTPYEGNLTLLLCLMFRGIVTGAAGHTTKLPLMLWRPIQLQLNTQARQ